MIEAVLSSIAIVVSVMVAVFVILRKPQKGDTGPMGPMGPKGDMGLPGRDGAAWVFRHNPDTDEYEVGYLIRTVSTDYEYSDVFYIVRKYKNERDAMKRVSYLNGGNMSRCNSCKYYNCAFNCKDCPMFQQPGEEDYPYNCYCVAHCCDNCKYYEVDNEEH